MENEFFVWLRPMGALCLRVSVAIASAQLKPGLLQQNAAVDRDRRAGHIVRFVGR